MCCVPYFTGGSYSGGGSSGSDVSWVDDGGRSERMAAAFLSHPRPSFTMHQQPQPPTDYTYTDADMNSRNAGTSSRDGYGQGRTLVHLSAQRKRFRLDKGYLGGVQGVF
jgi:hypothetical protein